MTKLPSQYKHKKTVISLLVGCLSMLLCYLSLVGLTVVNVMHRQNIEREIVQIAGNISQVEFSYLKEKSSINESFAKENGFVDVSTSGVAKQSNVSKVNVNEI